LSCLPFSSVNLLTSMSKIAIISRPEQGVLIDVSGCSTTAEAFELLHSTLKVSSKFWTKPGIGLNFGSLQLTANDVVELLKLTQDAEIVVAEVFSQNHESINLLKQSGIAIGVGKPMTVLSINSLTDSGEDVGQLDKPKDDLSNITIYEDDSSPTAKQSSIAVAKPVTAEKSCQQEKVNESVLYLKQTLRAGQAVSHKGHLVIVGDVNAGAEIEAEGDITVWGSLRGIAHAGIAGNKKAEIRALRLAPIQIRIGNVIARSPDRKNVGSANHVGPELAKLVGSKICITGNAVE
jgi:septum site-determining protein MinC